MDWDLLFSWVSVRLFGQQLSATAIFTPAQNICSKASKLEFDSIEPNKTGVNTPLYIIIANIWCHNPHIPGHEWKQKSIISEKHVRKSTAHPLNIHRTEDTGKSIWRQHSRLVNLKPCPSISNLLVESLTAQQRSHKPQQNWWRASEEQPQADYRKITLPHI